MRWRLWTLATETEASKSLSKPFLFPPQYTDQLIPRDSFGRVYHLSDPNSDFVFSSTAFASCFILSGSILKLTSTLLLSVSRVVDMLNHPRTKPTQIAIARKIERTKSSFFIIVIPWFGLGVRFVTGRLERDQSERELARSTVPSRSRHLDSSPNYDYAAKLVSHQ